MKHGSRPLLTFAALLAGPCLATHAVRAQPAPDEITVRGLKNGYRLDARRLQLARQAFDRHRGFAPQAPLRFRIEDRSGQPEPLRLWLRSGDSQTDLPLPAGRAIELPPEAFAAGAVLYANRARKALRIQPEIASPGTSDHARRLGDLRLQCRVLWAMAKDDVPFPIKVLFGGAGEICVTRRVPVYFGAPFPLRSAAVEAGGQSHPVPISKGTGYHPPIEDKTLPDSALVRLN